MVQINNNPYKTYLLDTCAASELVKHQEQFGSKIIRRVFGDGILCLSPYTFWEVKDAPALYTEFKDIFTQLPTYIVKTDIELFEEELAAYNKLYPDISPLHVPLLKKLYVDKGIDIDIIIDTAVEKSRIDGYKQTELELHNEFKNVIVGLLNENNLLDAKEVQRSVNLLTYKNVIERNLSFAKREAAAKREVDVNKFPSLKAINFIYHYKYGDGTRKPVKSDITDILISPVLPYIDVFITEGNLKENIQQIRNRHGFFKDIEVVSIKDVRRDWT